MANHKSAIKRIRQNNKARAQNSAQKSSLRTIAKRVEALVIAKDVKGARAALLEAEKALSSAASKKLIHRKNASRKISRLSARVNALSA